MKITVRILFSFLLSLTIQHLSWAQPGSPDISFNANDDGFGLGDGFNLSANAIAMQQDGKILVGGLFSRYNSIEQSNLSRLNADGTLDNTFLSNAGSNILSITIQEDGKIIIGGSFTNVQGTNARRISRLLSDGSLDPEFITGNGFNAAVNAILLLPDGKILVGGAFTSYDGTMINRIIKLNSDGTIDDSFTLGSGFNNSVNVLKLQNDGKILIGGSFTSYNGIIQNGLTRLNADGSLDSSFLAGTGFGATGNIRALALLNNGKILVGGSFTSFDGIFIDGRGIIRLNADGTRDNEFDVGTGINNSVFSINVQQDQKIVLTGSFTNFNNESAGRIVRLHADGALDESYNTGAGFVFDNNPNVIAWSILDSNDRLIAVGDFKQYKGLTRNHICRINQDGDSDPSFNRASGINSSIVPISNVISQIQSDGKILVGGTFTSYNGFESRCLVRLNVNGTIDSSFITGEGFKKAGMGENINVIKQQADGKILVGGDFDNYNNVPRRNLVRINADGSVDNSFDIGTGFNNTIFDILVLPDEKILVAGLFNSYNGSNAGRIIRLNPDGTADASFSTGTGFNNVVRSLSQTSDGNIIAGGNFTSFNGMNARYVAQLNTNGSLDNSFNAGNQFNNIVYKTLLQTDGKIVVAGQFGAFIGPGAAPDRIARLQTDGMLDNTFNPGSSFNGTLNDIALLPNQNIVVGGNFSVFNGQNTPRIAVLNNIGSLDETFITGSGFNESVGAISVQANGHIIVTGNFTAYDSIGRNRIARLFGYCENTAFTDTQFACNEFTWIDGITYSESNSNATFTLINAAGCDSTITLNLNIENIDASVTDDSPMLTASFSGGAYQWLDCNNNNMPIDGETQQSFVANANGSYAVEITSNGCSIVSECFEVTGLGFNAPKSENEFYIFPNPSTGLLNIKANGNKGTNSAKVFDVAGKVILQFTFTDELHSFKLDVKPGIYFIEISNPRNRETLRLIMN